MKLKEIKGLGVSELRQRESELRRELFNLRMQKQIGALENPVRSRNVRRELARVLTISRQHAS